MQQNIRELKYTIISICIFIGALLVWELVVQLKIIRPFVLPAPSHIFNVLINDFDIIGPHLIATIRTTLLGIIIAIIFAFVFAIIMDLSFALRQIFFPFILLFQIVPIIILAPVLVIWFGFGMLTQLFTVILMVFFPMLITLNNGLSSSSIDRINLLKSMGASRFQIYQWVKIPNGLLHLFSGLRLSITYGITSAVISEWIGAYQGLGVLMIRSQKSFLIARVFAINVIIILISALMYLALRYLEKKCLPWKKYVFA